MDRVNWNGLPIDNLAKDLPDNLSETIFDYLPPLVSMTPVIEELAHKYLNRQITAQDYGAMQAAAFLRQDPKILTRSVEAHSN